MIMMIIAIAIAITIAIAQQLPRQVRKMSPLPLTPVAEPPILDHGATPGLRTYYYYHY